MKPIREHGHETENIAEHLFEVVRMDIDVDERREAEEDQIYFSQLSKVLPSHRKPTIGGRIAA